MFGEEKRPILMVPTIWGQVDQFRRFKSVGHDERNPAKLYQKPRPTLLVPTASLKKISVTLSLCRNRLTHQLHIFSSNSFPKAGAQLPSRISKEFLFCFNFPFTSHHISEPPKNITSLLQLLRFGAFLTRPTKNTDK